MKRELWKHTVDYAIRNLSVMDEEETRLLHNIQGYIEGFREEGVPDEICEDIKYLLVKLKNRSENSIELWKIDYVRWDAVRVLLEPFMSHYKLYKSDYDKWETLFWRSMNRR